MRIILYDEGVAEELNVEEIAQYLGQKTGKIGIEVRGNPFVSFPQDKVADYARRIAGIKIQGISQRILSEPEPLHGEVEYEKRRISGKTKGS